MKTEFDVSNIAWEIYKLLYEDNFVNGFKIESPPDGRKYIDEIYTVGNKKSSIALNLVEKQILTIQKDMHIQGLKHIKIL